MNPEAHSEGILFGIPEIAEIAGVQRSAVSNWRKRHSDFPTPRVDTPSGVLFALREVEQWLVENGKIDQRVPVSAVLWHFVDTMRGQWRPEQLEAFVVSALVYMEACSQAEADLSTLRISADDRWGSIRQLPDAQVLPHLLDAAVRIENANEILDGLLVDGFKEVDDSRHRHILDFLDAVDLASSEGTAPFELFEEAVDRFHARERFTQEQATPHELALLLARLAEGADVVFDPACGEGGVLLMAAVIREPAQSAPHRLLGWEINREAWIRARARFFLYGVAADLRVTNTLLEDPQDLPRADAVVLDPPYNQPNWGSADVYVSKRWRFGSPPPSSANMAWLQLAIEALKPAGRAFVLLPSASLAHGGREQRIRAGLLEAGVIEAVVLLPKRLRRDTSIPLVLWCAKPPTDVQQRDEVLVVDASKLGEAGRSTHALREDDIDALVELLMLWRREELPVVGPDDRLWWLPVPRAAIESANLQPSRYQFTTQIDPASLRRDREDLRGALSTAQAEATLAIRELLGATEERRDQ